MQVTEFDYTTDEIELNSADRWIKSELHNAIDNVITHFGNFRFDLITQAIYDFIWRDYCDWYVELCKPILSDKNNIITTAKKNAVRKTLLEVLETTLRLIHPFMPFISEELWQEVAPKMAIAAKTIMLQPYPKITDVKYDESAVQEISWLQKIINTVRTIRGENNIEPNAILPAIWFKKGTESEKTQAKNIDTTLLVHLAKIKNFGGWVEDNFQLPLTASQVIENGTLEIYIEMQINKEAEIARLNKEKSKLQQEITVLSQKLGNAAFVSKAPPAIVTKEKERLEQSKNALAKIEMTLRKLA